MYEIEVKLPTGETVSYDYATLRTALDTGEFITIVATSVHTKQLQDAAEEETARKSLTEQVQKQQEEQRKRIENEKNDAIALAAREERKTLIKEILVDANVPVKS